MIPSSASLKSSSNAALKRADALVAGCAKSDETGADTADTDVAVFGAEAAVDETSPSAAATTRGDEHLF